MVGVHTVVFSGCIRVCDYSWGESIQLCLVVVYECVTTRGGSPYVALVVVYECVTTCEGNPYRCV